MEIGERLKLQEMENALGRFKTCPKCNSAQGFWLGLKRDHAYVQCKGCGASFELFEFYAITKKGEAPKLLKFLRK
jgi:transcription elongation factor Elf1